MTPTTAYRMEVHLVGGETVVCDLPAEGAERLAKQNPGFRVPAEESDEALGIARMLYTMLLYRMQKGEGFYQLTDLDDRQWVFRAEAILAFNVRAPKGRTLGFEALAAAPE
jgi:hypothetical protein